MSISQRHYMTYGVNVISLLKNDEDLYEEFEEICESMELNFVYDGENEDFAVIGKILNKGDEYEGLSAKGYSIDELRKIESELIPKMTFLPFDVVAQIQVFSFTQWV